MCSTLHILCLCITVEVFKLLSTSVYYVGLSKYTSAATATVVPGMKLREHTA